MTTPGPDVRAYLAEFTGISGQNVSVTFDRYGRDARRFHTLTQEQATQEALGAVIARYGPDWVASCQLRVITDGQPA